MFKVTDVVVPKTDMNSPEAKTISQNLNRSMANDVFAQYVTKVQSDIGVKINRNVISQVVSGGSGTSGDDNNDANF